MMSQADAMMMIGQRDKGGRTPIDVACYLGFANIALYL